MESLIGDNIGDFVKLVVVLGGILLLAYGTLRWWLPRMTGIRPGARGPIQVVSRFPLEPRKTLYLLKVGGTYQLLSSTDNAVRPLATLTPEEIEPYLEREAENPAAPAIDFRKLLRGLRK